MLVLVFWFLHFLSSLVWKLVKWRLYQHFKHFHCHIHVVEMFSTSSQILMDYLQEFVKLVFIKRDSTMWFPKIPTQKFNFDGNLVCVSRYMWGFVSLNTLHLWVITKPKVPKLIGASNHSKFVWCLAKIVRNKFKRSSFRPLIKEDCVLAVQLEDNAEVVVTQSSRNSTLDP